MVVVDFGRVLVCGNRRDPCRCLPAALPAVLRAALHLFVGLDRGRQTGGRDRDIAAGTPTTYHLPGAFSATIAILALPTFSCSAFILWHT